MNEHFKDIIKLNNDMKMNNIFKGINTAVERAERKHETFPTSIIHQVAILAEESGEVVQAVLNHNDHGKDAELIDVELYQTIAVCIRMLKHRGKSLPAGSL